MDFFFVSGVPIVPVTGDFKNPYQGSYR